MLPVQRLIYVPNYWLIYRTRRQWYNDILYWLNDNYLDVTWSEEKLSIEVWPLDAIDVSDGDLSISSSYCCCDAHYRPVLGHLTADGSSANLQWHTGNHHHHHHHHHRRLSTGHSQHSRGHNSHMIETEVWQVHTKSSRVKSMMLTDAGSDEPLCPYLCWNTTIYKTTICGKIKYDTTSWYEF